MSHERYRHHQCDFSSRERFEHRACTTDDFEGVPREEAIAALEQAYERLLEGLPRPESVAELTPTRSSLLTGQRRSVHRRSENLTQGTAEARE
jgi:hypothetical protein